MRAIFTSKKKKQERNREIAAVWTDQGFRFHDELSELEQDIVDRDLIRANRRDYVLPPSLVVHDDHSGCMGAYTSLLIYRPVVKKRTQHFTLETELRLDHDTEKIYKIDYASWLHSLGCIEHKFARMYKVTEFGSMLETAKNAAHQQFTEYADVLFGCEALNPKGAAHFRRGDENRDEMGVSDSDADGLYQHDFTQSAFLNDEHSGIIAENYLKGRERIVLLHRKRELKKALVEDVGAYSGGDLSSDV